MKKTAVSGTKKVSVKSSKKSPNRLKQKPRRIREAYSYYDHLSSGSPGVQGMLSETMEEAAGGNERPSAQPAEAAGSRATSLLGSFGGIDGIISVMTKAQQVFKLFQQMGPLFKMISAFGGAKAATASLRSGKRPKRVSRKSIR